MGYMAIRHTFFLYLIGFINLTCTATQMLSLRLFPNLSIWSLLLNFTDATAQMSTSRFISKPTRSTAPAGLVRQFCKVSSIISSKDISRGGPTFINREGGLNFYLDISLIHLNCLIPQAGSTTWFWYSSFLQHHAEVIESREEINILPVRHPFLRLVSAYRDKFCDGKIFTCNRNRFKKEMQEFWVPFLISSGRLQRTEAFNEMFQTLKPSKGTNKNFWVIIEKSYGTQFSEIVQKYSNITVTFEEFVQHVFWTYENSVGDHHWCPQTILCDVCRQDYRYILHQEHFAEEIPYVIKKIGYNKLPNIPKKNVHGEGNSSSSYLRFYKTLSKNSILRLLEMYKNDFELLGYSLC
ncbi:unnamed protein product, partial [Meganyctiphanes norvegica]